MTRREVVTPAPVRLRGVVRAPVVSAAAFRRVTLVADGNTVATFDEGELELELPGGRTVIVEVPAQGTRLIEPSVATSSGAWSELREGPDAIGLARNVVAPFAAVDLRTIRAPAGETVEVYGD